MQVHNDAQRLYDEILARHQQLSDGDAVAFCILTGKEPCKLPSIRLISLGLVLACSDTHHTVLSPSLCTQRHASSHCQLSVKVHNTLAGCKLAGLCLQVVVHNLPWNTTWQQLKDAFVDTGTIERADVIIDSSGRSRCAQWNIIHQSVATHMLTCPRVMALHQWLAYAHVYVHHRPCFAHHVCSLLARQGGRECRPLTGCKCGFLLAAEALAQSGF